MKKSLIAILLLVLVITGCSSKSETSSKDIETLTVFFVPSRDSKEIIAATEPLKELIKTELAKDGYKIGNVKIEVSPNYEAAGEALDAGKAHIGFIPASTYVMYAQDKNIDVILSATRNGLNKDSENGKDWNDGTPTEWTTNDVTFYRSLIYAGTSPKAQELTAKVNSGEKLTWDDVNSATWCHSNTTSSAGYVYPSLWLSEQFDGKMISDLTNKIEVTGYPDTTARLSNGQCDVGVGFADMRLDYNGKWVSEWGKTNIWTETAVIGVTDKIMNDTITVSNKLVDKDLQTALKRTFIEIAKTEEGQKAIAIYNHKGYEEVTDAAYDSSRKVMELLKSKN